MTAPREDSWAVRERERRRIELEHELALRTWEVERLRDRRVIRLADAVRVFRREGVAAGLLALRQALRPPADRPVPALPEALSQDATPFLEEASRHLRDGQLGEARRAASRALDVSPADPRALDLLVRTGLADDDVSAALEAVRALREVRDRVRHAALERRLRGWLAAVAPGAQPLLPRTAHDASGPALSLVGRVDTDPLSREQLDADDTLPPDLALDDLAWSLLREARQGDHAALVAALDPERLGTAIAAAAVATALDIPLLLEGEPPGPADRSLRSQKLREVATLGDPDATEEPST